MRRRVLPVWWMPGATPIGEAVGVPGAAKRVRAARTDNVRVALLVFRMSTAARMDMPPAKSVMSPFLPPCPEKHPKRQSRGSLDATRRL